MPLFPEIYPADPCAPEKTRHRHAPLAYPLAAHAIFAAEALIASLRQSRKRRAVKGQIATLDTCQTKG